MFILSLARATEIPTPFGKWMEITARRLEHTIKAQKINLSAVVRDAGVGRSTLYRIIHREGPMTIEIASLLAEPLRLPVDWLLAIDFVQDFLRENEPEAFLPTNGAGVTIAPRILGRARRSAPWSFKELWVPPCDQALTEAANLLRGEGWLVVPPFNRDSP